MAKNQSQLTLFLDNLTSNNEAMQRCLALACEAARSDLPILLQGETGTGKTLLAQAIHNSSLRHSRQFISFNASAMSETLLESQLFGHEKGAFTGATSLYRGKFEVADGGTLFFDEIADMSSIAQAKILRAVEYGEFERLGAEKLGYADVRIISATNKPLRQLSQSGEFREDLFHRLNGLTIWIPPLRERSEDLPVIIASELKQCSEQAGKTITAIDPQAFNKLLSYSWPGNLRELHRVMQTIVLFAKEDTVYPKDIVLDEDMPEPGYHESNFNGHSSPVQRDRQDSLSVPSPSASSGDGLDLEFVILKHVKHVYELSGRNKRQTANMLGISRSTLDRKLKALQNG